MTEITLPNPAMPTYHPDFLEGRHPKVNVFSIIPLAQALELNAGDTAPLNVATYVDPYAEMDYQRLVARRPRWQQGLLVRFDVLQLARAGEFRDTAVRTNFPADRVFAGNVINHGAKLPVVGAIHPEYYGWLAFDHDAFGDKTLKTIADLKAEIGQITPRDALEHYKRYKLYGTFLVNHQEYS